MRALKSEIMMGRPTESFMKMCVGAMVLERSSARDGEGYGVVSMLGIITIVSIIGLNSLWIARYFAHRDRVWKRVDGWTNKGRMLELGFLDFLRQECHTTHLLRECNCMFCYIYGFISCSLARRRVQCCRANDWFKSADTSREQQR
jgi:hypothetical protein